MTRCIVIPSASNKSAKCRIPEPEVKNCFSRLSNLFAGFSYFPWSGQLYATHLALAKTDATSWCNCETMPHATPPSCTMFLSFGQPCSACCNIIQHCTQHVASVWPHGITFVHPAQITNRPSNTSESIVTTKHRACIEQATSWDIKSVRRHNEALIIK